jgi:membrane protein involved in colicin uptake
VRASQQRFFDHLNTPAAGAIRRYHEATVAAKEHLKIANQEVATLRKASQAAHEQMVALDQKASAEKNAAAATRDRAAADAAAAASTHLEAEANKIAAQAAKDKAAAEQDAAGATMATIAGVIAGRRAQAGVEVVFDTGKGLEALADHDYEAAVEYFAAAAEMAKIAFSHGAHHGGGGGGGDHSSGAGSSRSDSSGSGRDHNEMPPQLDMPGGPAAQGYGKAIQLNVYGHVFADNLQTLVNKISAGVDNGTVRLSASTSATTPIPKA